MKWEKKGHEFDDIGYLLKDKRNIFIYGAGESSRELIQLLEKINFWTNWKIFLIDGDQKKQEEGVDGYAVLKPEIFFAMEKKDFFVIAGAVGKTGDEIYSILVSRLPKDTIIFKSFYFIHTYLSVYFAYEHNKVFFASESILPSTLCNLNCRDCLNFTPYIKNHCTDTLEELKQTTDLFFSAVDLVYRFQITGGEPLLYKQLLPFLEYIDANYREKILRFEMVTNGTIVPDDATCRFFKEKNMYIFLDDYRMSLPDGEERYQQVKNKLLSYNIAFADNHVDEWMRMYVPEEDESSMEYSESALIKKYSACSVPWSTLWRGTISSCNYALYAAKAGLCNLGEMYDLKDFTAEKKKELVEFRLGFNEKGYVDFCKKCGGWININKRWCTPAIQVERKV